MEIMEKIRADARKEPQKIVFPEPEDPRVLKAATELKNEGALDSFLIGCRKAIDSVAKEHAIDISGIEVRDPAHDAETEGYARDLFETRKHKGMTEEEAKESAKDPVYFGMLMIKSGHADGLVSGAVHSTADTLRPALQLLKGKEKRIASSFFLMLTNRGPLLFADCAINIEPSAEELAQIAEDTASSAEMLDIVPKVAMLSFSSRGSGKHHSVDKMAEATSILKEKRKDLVVDGELQVDAAIVPEVANSKAEGSPLKGEANILIFPDLNAGNIGYKLVERLGDASAIGPIVQGVAGAVNDLSRGCSEQDIKDVAAITALQAIRLKK